MSTATFTPQLPSPAMVFVLGPDDKPKDRLGARVLHCAGKMMKLETPCAIAPGEALRIDVDGGLVLGETAQCLAAEEGIYACYIVIRQVIPSVAELANLVRAVLGQRSEPEEFTRRGAQPQTEQDEAEAMRMAQALRRSSR